MNLLGTFQSRLVAIPSIVLLYNDPELALQTQYREKKNPNFGHQFFFTDIKQFLLAHGYVALTNDMLKAYKVAQV
jgi:hypothetical protein